MNDRPIAHRPDPGGQGNWLDAYLPEGQVAPHQPQARMIDVATIRGILFRQRWLIAGVLATSVIIGILITLLATPMYQAQSSVRIEPYGNFIIEGQDVQTGIASNQVWDLLQTQMGIIESRSLARTVAEDLNLGERTDFFGEEFEESRPANVSDERWREVKLEAAAEEL